MFYNRKYIVYNFLVHPFISVVTPFTLFLALSAIFQTYFPGSVFILPSQVAVIFGTGIVKIYFNRFYKKERIRNVHVLREFVFSAVILYLLISLLQGKAPAESFTPVPSNVYPFILCVAQWLFTFVSHRLLIPRERLLAVIGAEDLHGEALRDFLKKGNYDLAESTANLEKIKRLLFLLFSVFLIFLITTWMFQTASDDRLFYTAFLFISVFVIARMLVNLFIQEHHLYWEGITTNKIRYGKRIGFALLLIAVSGAVALLFANSTPIVDLSRFRIRLPFPSNNWETYFEQGRPWSDPVAMTLDRMTKSWETPFTSVFRIVWIVIAVLVGGFILFFLFAPFFSRNFRQFIRSSHPLRYCVQKMRAAGAFMAFAAKNLMAFIGALFSRKLRIRLRTQKRKKRTGQKRRGKGEIVPGFGKIIQTDRILRHFFKIMRWAKRQQVYYHFGQTASDYVMVLTGLYPAAAGEFITILTVFERALFSHRPVERAEVHAYTRSVKTVLRLRTRNRGEPVARGS